MDVIQLADLSRTDMTTISISRTKPERRSQLFDYIEQSVVHKMGEVEFCLYDFYAYQNIRDVRLLTRKVNFVYKGLGKDKFSQDTINQALHNARKLVSYRYRVEKYFALEKFGSSGRRWHQLSEIELSWDDWAMLAAVEEGKTIRAGSTSGGSSITATNEDRHWSGYVEILGDEILEERFKTATAPRKSLRKSAKDKWTPYLQSKDAHHRSLQSQTVYNCFPEESMNEKLQKLYLLESKYDFVD